MERCIPLVGTTVDLENAPVAFVQDAWDLARAHLSTAPRLEEMENACRAYDAALSAIDYALGEPNEMQCSLYDVDLDAERVVAKVKSRIEEMERERDETPIDMDWIASLRSGEQIEDDIWRFCSPVGIEAWVWDDSTINFGDVEVRERITRGQFRKICKGLGISLKESK